MGTGNYMDSLENLLTALEIYRDVEQQTVNRIKEIMAEHNILIPAPEVEKWIQRKSGQGLPLTGRCRWWQSRMYTAQAVTGRDKK